MVHIEVVSFDMEGTLIDNTFSQLIGETDIPALYGQRHGLSLEDARVRVFKEYAEIGEDRPEWYDAGYWFRRFDLPGDWRQLPEGREDDCTVYTETGEVLRKLAGEYRLIIASNTIREFLDVQLRKLPDVFEHVFSAPSDFNSVKKTKEFYGRICQIIGVESGSVVHVGDSLRFDYEEARELGIHAFHLDREREFSGLGVVHDLLEFADRLKGLKSK